MNSKRYVRAKKSNQPRIKGFNATNDQRVMVLTAYERNQAKTEF